MLRRKLLVACFFLLAVTGLRAQQNLKNALNFDGIDDYVSFPAKSQYNISTGTIECWVKPGLLLGNACIIANRSAAIVRYSFHMSLTNISCWNGLTLRSIPFIALPGVWYHVAFVCGATSTLVYVNGEVAGTITNTINSTAFDLPITVGIPYAGYALEKWFGAIDEVRIWKTAVSQDLIKQNMYTSITADANLVGLFHFNEGLAEGVNTALTTVADNSPVANVGILNNFSLSAGLSNFVLSVGLSFNTRPLVTSFTPTSGPVSTTVVTVTGSGFSLNPANNMVWFGPVRAAVTAATATTLTLKVPIGATYQNFSITNVETGLIGYSKSPFQTTYAGTGLTLNTKYDLNDVVSPSAITYADMDGDGKADLIVTDQAANQVQIYRNISVNGTVNAGSFATKATFLSGTFTAGVVAGDLDGDGKLDLATAPGADGLVGVYLNTSSVGSILMSSRVTVGLGLVGSGKKVEVADLDLDGKPEIIVLATNGVSILRNFSVLGALSLSVGTGFPLVPSFSDMEVVDMDGDGLQDIILVNPTQSRLSIYRNISVLGLVELGIRQDVAIADVPYKIDAADLDSDGKPDLAIACQSNLSLNLYKNTSSPGFISLAAKVSVPTGLISEGVTMGDLDGDNKPDVVLSNGAAVQIAYYKNQSTAGLITSATLAPPVFYPVSGVANQTQIADIDADGKPDLTIMSPNFITVLGNTTQNLSLPVELTAFTGTANANDISLSWTTTYENNSDRFEIERSNNGIAYTKVGTVAAAGFSGSKTDYSWVDKNPVNGVNIYRLHQVDKDGKAANSKSISIYWNSSARVSVSFAPQPMRDYMNVTIKGVQTNSDLSVYDINGRKLKSYNVNGGNTLRINRAGFSAGTYVYTLSSAGGKLLEKGKFVVE